MSLESTPVVQTIKTFADFFEVYNARFRNADWLFRGQADAQWGLATSLERVVKNGIDLYPKGRSKVLPFPPEYGYLTLFEKITLAAFQEQAHLYCPDTPDRTDALGWFALMQHYGAPTRLLDFTQSAYVALFFAIELADDVLPSAVWAINKTQLRVGMPRLLRDQSAGAPGLDATASDHHNYVNELIRSEIAINAVYALRPLRMSQRSIFQQGWFLFPVNAKVDFEANLTECLSYSPGQVEKIVIEPQGKLDILRELARMNVHAAALFPGLDGLARSLRHVNHLAFHEVFNTPSIWPSIVGGET